MLNGLYFFFFFLSGPVAPHTIIIHSRSGDGKLHCSHIYPGQKYRSEAVNNSHQQTF